MLELLWVLRFYQSKVSDGISLLVNQSYESFCIVTMCYTTGIITTCTLSCGIDATMRTCSEPMQRRAKLEVNPQPRTEFIKSCQCGSCP